MLDHAYKAPLANIKIERQGRPARLLISGRSGTQYIAMVAKLVYSYSGAHVLESYCKGSSISDTNWLWYPSHPNKQTKFSISWMELISGDKDNNAERYKLRIEDKRIYILRHPKWQHWSKVPVLTLPWQLFSIFFLLLGFMAKYLTSRSILNGILNPNPKIWYEEN